MIQISEILELSLFKDFKIICGEKYLNNIVNATVILEYESSRIDYEGYGYGYFVLLSYFFADSDPELVNGTLRTLIQKQVSGIAIKIQPDQELPEDIIKLAKLYHVPLFSFYEQFMEDLIICINESMKTRAQYVIAEEKLNSIVNEKHKPSTVEKIALEINPHFHPSIITANITSRDMSNNLKIHTYFDKLMYRQYRDTKVHDYSFVKMGHGIMLICSYQEDNIPEDYQNMLHHINDILVEAGFLPESYHIGICDEILPLDRLNEAIIKSKNANIVGQFFEQTDTAYSQIGIYKYVMSLVNNPMLYHEVEESVSILQKYDASHDVNLLETVISYVKNNGDFAKTSEELFQHSNTVRYRIRKAEQLLGLPDFATAEEMALIIRCYLLHNVMTLND